MGYRTLQTLAIVLMVATPVFAEEPTPLRWSSHGQVPARISDALVGVNLGLDAIHAFRADDHRERWAFACRVGLALGISEGVKRLVNRERPNRADQKSMPSMHTALASTAAGYQPAWSVSFAVAVAWGRQAGGWHYATDTLVGAGIGGGANWLCDRATR